MFFNGIEIIKENNEIERPYRALISEREIIKNHSIICCFFNY